MSAAATRGGPGGVRVRARAPMPIARARRKSAVVVTRASARRFAGRSSERGHAKSATDAPRRRAHRSTGPTARPASEMPDAGVRGGSASAARGRGRGRGRRFAGCARGGVSASSVGLVDAPGPSRKRSRRPPARRGRRKRTPRHRQEFHPQVPGQRRSADGSRVETTRRRHEDDRRVERQASITRRSTSAWTSLERLLEAETPRFSTDREEAFSRSIARASLDARASRSARRDAEVGRGGRAVRGAPPAPTADKDVDAQEVRCVELAENDAVVRGWARRWRLFVPSAKGRGGGARDSEIPVEARVSSAADGDLVLVSAAFLGPLPSAPTSSAR